ncbi:hypothetical protein GOODEAATRI_018007 [Goodea atripinnis]|uniref:Uncharacterized protein n=1 Tax=Goodea atripinnis TaxID=208336 RepID=A0ABV0PPK6_9TELE
MGFSSVWFYDQTSTVILLTLNKKLVLNLGSCNMGSCKVLLKNQISIFVKVVNIGSNILTLFLLSLEVAITRIAKVSAYVCVCGVAFLCNILFPSTQLHINMLRYSTL